MKTVGIICEYNPFHLGHARQLRLIREQLGADTAIVCVMSGNYVQRGAPAMWDKFTRARVAVACGADLVLEMPITKVLQSAEGFAHAGVQILTQLGCVDVLCFGAECGNTDALVTIAHKLNDPTTEEILQQKLSDGLSYAAAKQAAINDTQNILSTPNNILAVEYCRAIERTGSLLKPMAVQRNGDYHSVGVDLHEPSATAVRNLYPNNSWESLVPEQTASILSQASYYAPEFGERAVLARLRAMGDEEWQFCAHGSEGLWSKAMKAARSEPTLELIIQATKSKRYPRTRIQRLFLCAYLGITQQELDAPFPYCRVLAFSDFGRSIIRKAKENSELTLINAGEQVKGSSFYNLETRCSDLFTLFCAQDLTICAMEKNARLSP